MPHSGVRGPSWLKAQLFAHTRRNWITSPQRAICSFTEFFMPLSFSIDLGWKEFSVTPDWCSQAIWHHWAFSQSPRIISRIVTFEIWRKIPWVSRRTLELDILTQFLNFFIFWCFDLIIIQCSPAQKLWSPKFDLKI